MIKDEKRLEKYHIVKFENLMADPIGYMKIVYKKANLDFRKINKIRFKAKKHFHRNGRYNSGQYIPGKHYWFDPDNLSAILEPDINRYKINRLEKYEIDKLLKLTKKTCQYLDY